MSIEELFSRAEELQESAVTIRRDLHRYPEGGFCEYRTASKIIGTLRELGYTVLFGDEVCDTSATVGLPSAEEQQVEMERAAGEGADPLLLSRMADGKTGVVGILDGAAGGTGKTVAFRFDMDANDVAEATDDAHRPVREGFSSVHTDLMHACGHDGHVAIGLTLARLLSENRGAFSGRVKLIFQPAEEGVRGAEAMLRRGVSKDVDVFFGGHIGLSARENGMLIASVGEFLAADKFDAVFTGKSSHAGAAPEEGRNALLAAAQAALALHAIPRHGKGASRVNVGVLHAGTGRNVVADRAEMQYETRGVTTEIGAYMEAEARRIINAAAEMHGVEVSLTQIAHVGAFLPDDAFGKELAVFARSLGVYDTVEDYGPMNASEDCTAFLSQVVENGGRAVYMMYGSRLAAGHHNGRFDFDEAVLGRSAALLAALATRYTGAEG